MNGASLAEIAAVLGHKTLSMVKRYSHLSDSHTAGVVEKMMTGTHFLNKHYPSNLSTNSVSQLTQIYQQKNLLKNTTTQICVNDMHPFS